MPTTTAPSPDEIAQELKISFKGVRSSSAGKVLRFASELGAFDVPLGSDTYKVRAALFRQRAIASGAELPPFTEAERELYANAPSHRMPREALIRELAANREEEQQMYRDFDARVYRAAAQRVLRPEPRVMAPWENHYDD